MIISKIKSISVVTSEGGKTYTVGDIVNGKQIKEIIKVPYTHGLVDGDVKVVTYHWAGFADQQDDFMVFTISVNCPTVIEYE